MKRFFPSRRLCVQFPNTEKGMLSAKDIEKRPKPRCDENEKRDLEDRQTEKVCVSARVNEKVSACEREGRQK